MNKKALQSAIALAGVSAFALTACTGPSGGGTATGSAAGGGTITYGTTDKVVTLDPAGSYDAGSFMVMNQIYPFLLNSKPGTADSTPGHRRVRLLHQPDRVHRQAQARPEVRQRPHARLLRRQVLLRPRRQRSTMPTVPPRLLANLDIGRRQGCHHRGLHAQGRQRPGLPAASSQPTPGRSSTKRSSRRTSCMTDDEIVKGKPFHGQYTIESYKKNELVSLKANPDYQGLLGKPANDGATIKYYADSNNLKLDVQQGNIDVAGRSLTRHRRRRPRKGLQGQGPQGPRRRAALHRVQLRHHAVRRQGRRRRSREGACRPPGHGQRRRPRRHRQPGLQGHLPAGRTPSFPTASSAPSSRSRKCTATAAASPASTRPRRSSTDAGVTAPVTIKLQYNPDHYGKSSGDEYAMIKEQLEKSGLFTVDLQSTEWVTYSKDRRADAYPVYQLGWFPDYSDADNYLTPFFVPGQLPEEPLREPRRQRSDQQAAHHRRQDRARKGHRRGPEGRRQGPLHAAAAAGRPADGRRQRTSRVSTQTLDASFKTRLGCYLQVGPFPIRF